MNDKKEVRENPTEQSRDSNETSEDCETKQEQRDELLSVRKDKMAIQKSKARVLWRKLSTVVKLTRKMIENSQPSLVLVSSHDKTSSAWNKMKSMVKLTQMANRLLTIRKKSRGQVPRAGGHREEGSFDTLGK